MVRQDDPRNDPAAGPDADEVAGQATAGRTESERRRSLRAIAATALVVVSAIAVVTTTVAVWAHTTLVDTDAWMETVEPVITSDEFTAELAERVSVAVIEAADVEGRLRVRLGAVDAYVGEQLVEALEPSPAVTAALRELDVPRLSDLAVPIAEAANQRIRSAIDDLIRSDGFRDVLVPLVQRGHEAAVALASDIESLENVYLAEGEVRWDLVPLVLAGLERVVEQRILGGDELELPDLSDAPVAGVAIARLSESLDVELPPDFAQVTLMSEDQLTSLQTAADLFEGLVWALIAITAALIIAALVVSPRRARTAIELAGATLIAALVAGLIVDRIVETIQAGLPDEGVRSVFAVLAEVMDASLGRAWLLAAAGAMLLGALVLLMARRPTEAPARAGG